MTTPIIIGFTAVSANPALDSVYGAGDRLIIDLYVCIPFEYVYEQQVFTLH
jgi:hypothetical protein